MAKQEDLNKVITIKYIEKIIFDLERKKSVAICLPDNYLYERYMKNVIYSFDMQIAVLRDAITVIKGVSNENL